MFLKKMILTYLISVVTSVKALHIGSMVFKLKAATKLSILLSPFPLLMSLSKRAVSNESISEMFSKLSVDDQQYIIIVLIAIGIDHALGTYKHAFIDRDFTWVNNIKGIAVKVGLVVTIGFLFEGLNIIITKDTIVKDYLTIVGRLIVFLYPAGSAFGNSSVISGGKFPPKAWLDKLKSFQQNLDLKELSNQDDEVVKEEPLENEEAH